MTDITWGREIEVNGVRPDWLAGYTGKILGVDLGSDSTLGEWMLTGFGRISWPCVAYIKLPADHPHYQKSETDHSEAREPLSDAEYPNAPVDRGTDGMFKGRDGQLLHEPTLRTCIEAIPIDQAHIDTVGRVAAFNQSRLALEVILPRGQAEDLLDDFDDDCPTADGSWGDRDYQLHLLNWLIKNDRIKL